ncbi:MAG: alpha/beta fold hydrolase BchO [Pseudomonadota bacterium]
MLSASRNQLDWARDRAHWPLHRHSRFVMAGGLRWHVQQYGHGPDLVLVHGTGSSTHTWARLGPVLAERFSITTFDLPGHGFTEPARTRDTSISGFADLTFALLSEVGVHPHLMVGHSAGAAILARMILDQRVTPNVVIGLNAAFEPFPGVAGAIFPTLAKLLYVNPLVPRLFAARARDERVVRDLLAETGSQVPSESAALYTRLFRCTRHVRSTLKMMANWDLRKLRSELPDMTVPLVLFAGENDRTVKPYQSFEVASDAPTARAELIHKLGHLMHEEDPPRIADAIVEAHACVSANQRDVPA